MNFSLTTEVHFFAAYIDRRIEALHGNSKTYQDFMRSLKIFAEEKKENLSREDFISLTAEFIPEDEIRASFENYVLLGKIIPKEMLF